MDYITNVIPGCITFREATEMTDDYLLIRDGFVCNSQLGRVGGEQIMTLGQSCFTDGMITPAHELLHVLGFVHEHTRTLVLTAMASLC